MFHEKQGICKPKISGPPLTPKGPNPGFPGFSRSFSRSFFVNFQVFPGFYRCVVCRKVPFSRFFQVEFCKQFPECFHSSHLLIKQALSKKKVSCSNRLKDVVWKTLIIWMEIVHRSQLQKMKKGEKARDVFPTLGIDSMWRIHDIFHNISLHIYGFFIKTSWINVIFCDGIKKSCTE